ncbi:hypothetical protein KSD_78900 [Ktedonobacter sp. SOSP1-85]|uniref:DUF1697 domain-containing protein n=1 Tax=Ktedonobacter sp. SOSP1-85 TaxID=2778367 RepID=UPI001915AAD1|nr:DUF1697 domain-containing protein [Ktedonobacter sp. SOSP1-85]GHO80119.1 hypothetical protein KSD_78900 [Ktedonobacter sp. SOSP1-85]
MARFVALFRGVNVGGTQVRMDELKALHEDLDLTDVITYIRSGNVVFTGYCQLGNVAEQCARITA